MHRFTVDELLGRDGGSFGPSNLRKPFVMEELKAMTAWERESVNLRKNGETFPVHLTSIPVLDPGGAPIGLITACEDITERKRMENEIRRARDEWEETFSIINDAITIHDRDFNVIRANKAAEELLGIPALTIARQKCFVSYHGTDSPPAGCPSCETLGTGQPSVMEIFEPHLNKHLEVKALPRLSREGEIIGLVHIVRDITARKQAEEAARRSGRMTQEILENAPFGVYVVNADGIVDYVNPAMLRISGDRREEFLGTNVLELEGYRTSGIKEKIEGVLAGRPFSIGPMEYTSRFSRKTTTRKFVGIPLKSEHEIKALVIVEDVTERVRAEQEHAALQSQMIQSQKMDSIGKLAGGIAHDFNNILSAIIGYSELALLKMNRDHPAFEKVSIVRESAEKAADLTRQLLAFSRKQVLRMEFVDLRRIIDSMSKMLGRIIGEDIELVLVTAGPVTAVHADPTQVEQVIMNLAVNARDAMPLGGRLTIGIHEMRIGDEGGSDGDNPPPGAYVVITVSDTGVGMSSEVQDRIFEPFFTTKEVGKGTGLGLATVYGIVKQHSGFITVSSEPGSGTTFSVGLPAAEAGSIGTEREQEAALAGGTETILVVEDDPLTRSVVVDILRPLGYAVIVAASGDEALSAAERRGGAIDLLLTDVIMPGMDGKALADEIGRRWPRTPVIFMSGYTDDVIAPHGMLEDGVVLLEKPITPARLAATIRSMLDSRMTD